MFGRLLTYVCRGCITLALLWLVASVYVPLVRSNPLATATAMDTNTVTAAILLSIVRYTEWPAIAQPATAAAPFVIGVSGNRQLLDALIRHVESQQVRSHPVYIVRLKNVDDLAACHLAFLNSKPDSDGMGVPIPAALKALKGKPVLTVSFAEDFLADGGLLQLYRVDSRLGFAIASETARATGLMIDSRVLIQARPVPIQP